MLIMKCSRCGGEIPPDTNKVVTKIAVGKLVEKEGVPEYQFSHWREGAYCEVCSMLIEKYAENYIKEG
jgi:hypothetical protein